MIGNPTSTSPNDLIQAAAFAILAALLIAALYFGQPLLMPFALAVLLAFVLARPVRRLHGMGLPQTLAVILTVIVAVTTIAAFAAFIGVQVSRLASELPHYQYNLTRKIESVRGAAAGNKLVASGSALVQKLDNAITTTGNSWQQPPPVPVEIHRPATGPFDTIGNVISPLLQPIATIAIVVIFVIFILLGKDDLQNRVISLLGSRDIQRASTAMDEGARRLSSYLMLQTMVNGSVGLCIGTGLWLIGVPNPALWGLIVAIFRYVPYVGVPAAAAVPLALALAVDPGWTKVALTGALYLGVEAVAGNAVEPFLYGRNMGLTPIAVLLSAAFWTFVWGPVGLLLSTPLTMCLVVLGRHIEHLHFLDVLLGDSPPLSEDEKFYLRVVKGDPDELAQEAELQLRTHRLGTYYDKVALRGLALAQLDIKRGSYLSAEDSDRILSCVVGLIENLSFGHNDPDEPPIDDLAPTPLPAGWHDTPVLCVADRGPLNMAAALLLKDLLERYGIGVRVISAEATSTSQLDRLPTGATRLVCLSYLEPGDPASSRYLVRRLRKHISGAPVLAGFWSASQNDTHVLDWIEATGADIVACDLSTTVAEVIAVAVRHNATASSDAKPARKTTALVPRPVTSD